MPNRKTPLVVGEYYHIYNRGNSKQKIFLDDQDYDYFIKCLYCCNTCKSFTFREDIVKNGIDAFDFDRDETLVSIGAWTLMPNHFHIYITMSHKSDLWLSLKKYKDKNKISEFMRKVCTAYAKYFNSKYNRTGGLFESKFKSTHINNNNQAKYLFSYIHLNCVKLIQKDWKENGINDVEKALDFISKYKWSSYKDYHINERRYAKILDLEVFPKYFSNIKDFDKEILIWLKYKEA
ncbi:hypothetical protein A3J61_01555 [Candidatus Nomurabacteria bacterium RIFCSPHIGHO2_02_FULL_38_15]|uniref:Transposase IS200-like domain-containing protein n=1 Tax=Candidatus Nomurabacteria bacterium RIFCSPHIGHO2_02_FULL_38_15 TaxID=1801752 RepID=A0A1F6VRH9_9BACT|nr:MAG: hypothetical protein A3J61_01555 [Candidatus Nomurabacteria bacterium RIFCSPHIGHO2_02_FULL_38_15]